MNTSRQRIQELDLLQGIAMLLVIWGHNETSDADYMHFHHFVYGFHMPLFMFLSGYLAQYSLPLVTNLETYRSYISRKFLRLFIPYLIIGFLVLIFEYVRSGYDYNSFLTGTYYILFEPVTGPIQFLWYVHLLLVLYVFLPFFSYQNINLRILLWGGTFILIFIPITPCLGLSKLFNLLFYFLGGTLFANYKNSLVYVERKKYWAIGLFILISLIYELFYFDFVNVRVIRILLAVSVIFFLLSVSGYLNRIKYLSSFFCYVGKRCIWFYFLHVFVLTTLRWLIDYQEKLYGSYILYSFIMSLFSIFLISVFLIVNDFLRKRHYWHIPL